MGDRIDFEQLVSEQLSFTELANIPEKTRPTDDLNKAIDPAPKQQPQRLSGNPGSDLAPMMRHYLDLKGKYPEHLLLFQVGDFYEVFFDDAKIASQALGIRLTSRDKSEDSAIPMCGVPIHALDGYIPKLLGQGLSCVVVSQVEDAKNKKGMVKREVTRIVTPGVRYEGDGLEDGRFNYLAAVALGARGNGAISCVDVSTGHLIIREVEGVEALLEELDRIRPAEVILPSTLLNTPLNHAEGWLRFARERARGLASHIVVRPFRATSRGDLQERLCEQSNNVIHAAVRQATDTLGQEGVSVVSALLGYVNEVSFGTPPNIASVMLEEPSKVAFIDAATRANLELFESRFDGKRKNSLVDHIDYTKTAMGSRLLSQWLLLPSADLDTISARADAVEELTSSTTELERLREILAGVRDIERTLSRVTTGRATPRDLRLLCDSISELAEFSQLLGRFDAELLAETSGSFDSLDDIYTLLSRALVAEPPTKITEGGIFSEGYHSELDEIRSRATHGRELLLALEGRERQATGIASLRVRYNNVFGYFIEVTKSHLSKVPEHYERRQTLANAERFITTELRELEQSILSARARQVDLERELYLALRGEVAGQSARINQTARLLSLIDVLLGFAVLACERNYCRPKLFDDQRLIIKDGRHPVVEQVIGRHNFVPNDTLLNGDDRRFAVLTGPNMGGKSTYLRQVGIIQLLAQIGSFVPAGSAELGIADRVFTRIGAADDISRGDSTFMVEMREAATIVKRATVKSLVLIDEIGRGTATADGLSLATAIAEWLHTRIGCRAVFATHFHELTELPAIHPGMFCIAVGVIERDGEIEFTHLIEEKAADRSYGLEVARLAGLPEGLIGRARQLLDETDETPSRNYQFNPESSLSSQVVVELNSGDRKAIERLLSVDPNVITPVEALLELANLRKMIEE